MVEIGSVVEEKVSYVEYIKNKRKNKKFLNAYKLYLLLLTLMFALFDLFLRNDNYLTIIITLLSILITMEISTLIGQSIKYIILKPAYVVGTCPYCKEEIKFIREIDKIEATEKCPICRGKIEVEVVKGK